VLLQKQYPGYSSQQDKGPLDYDHTKASGFYYTDEEREVVEGTVVAVLGSKLFPWKKDIPQMLRAMDDSTLHSVVFEEQLKAHQESELQQFHAAKAFSGYIDQLVEEMQKS